MARAQTYSMEKILAARERLRELPAKEKEKSRTEVVELLRPDLQKLREQGYSFKEIQKVLAEEGLTISVSSMEAILGKSVQLSTRRRPGRPKRGRGIP